MQFVNETQNITVDINTYPEILETNASEVTLGDTHGNALYLLNSLIRLGIVSLSKENYESFKLFYEKDPATWNKNEFLQLDKLFSQLEVFGHRKLRLLGDIFADRGNNDYLTLKILEKLDQEGAEYTITLSNHDMEFISYLEQTNLFHDNYEKTLGEPEIYTRSLFGFRKLLHQATIDPTTKEQHLSPIKIQETIKSCVFKHMKAIDYSYAGKLSSHSLAIFSHTAIDINLIEQVARELDTPFDKTDSKMLARSIDSINYKIQDHLNNGTLIHLFPEIFPSNKRGVDVAKHGASALSRLLWNRDISDLNFSSAPLVLFFVHGHDQKSTAQGVYSLDGELGKSLKQHQGKMPIWLLTHQSKKSSLVVETTPKLTPDGQKVLCVDQFQQQGRFKIKELDNGADIIQVPLPKDMSYGEAERRLRLLYKYNSKITQTQALLISSPLFEVEVEAMKASKGYQENIITPERTQV